MSKISFSCEPIEILLFVTSFSEYPIHIEPNTILIASIIIDNGNSLFFSNTFTPS